MLWAVLRFFNYRKEVTHDVLSIHETEERALQWARKHCRDEYGEVFDVSNSLDLLLYGAGSPVYGPTEPYQHYIYHVVEAPFYGITPPAGESEAASGSESEGDSEGEGESECECEGEGEGEG